MSHSHRDENDLAEVASQEPEPAPPVVQPPAVSNSEAERRAAERRKAEGAADQVFQHEFTGDLPDPERGGTDVETRLVFGGNGDADASDPRGAPPASRRGPPPPRARLVEDDASWLAPPAFDVASLPAQPAWRASSAVESTTSLPAVALAWLGSDIARGT